MRYTKWISALMLLFLPIIAAAQMKPGERVVTQVPFKFMVGTVEMPAGEYTVQLTDQKAGILTVANRDEKLSTYAVTVPNLGSKAQNAALVFHRYGDRYFLAELKTEDSRTSYSFRLTKLEKELRAQNGSATDILLASK
jgi:hypothetical protein